MDDWLCLEEAARFLGMTLGGVNQLARLGQVVARRSETLAGNGRPAWEFRRDSLERRRERMRIQLPEGEEWVRFPEAVRMLGISRECLYKRIENGHIECQNFGPPEKPAIFFRRAEIEAHVSAPPRRSREKRTLSQPIPHDELVRLGALIDGEGCITIVRIEHARGRGVAWNLRLTIVNREGMEDIAALFGGVIRQRRTGHEKWADIHDWTATCAQAGAILRAVRPWIRWKARQADIAIEFQTHIESARYDLKNPMPDQVRAWRDEQVRRIQELNRRGPRV